VHEHAGASQIIEWLGHERRLHAVLVRHRFDQTFVAHCLIHRDQCVAVFKGDFHLAWRIFRDRRARRNAVQFAGTVEVGEERFDLLQFAQTVDLSVSRSAAIGIQRRLRTAVVIAFGVEQIELQFARHHRVITLGLEAVDDLDQQMTRVGDARWHPLGRVHADLHRRGGNLPPRQAHQTAFERVGAAVDVADVPHQPGVFHVLALHGQAEDGAG